MKRAITRGCVVCRKILAVHSLEGYELDFSQEHWFYYRIKQEGLFVRFQVQVFSAFYANKIDLVLVQDDGTSFIRIMSRQV